MDEGRRPSADGRDGLDAMQDVPAVERNQAWPALVKTGRVMGTHAALFAAVGGTYAGVEVSESTDRTNSTSEKETEWWEQELTQMKRNDRSMHSALQRKRGEPRTRGTESWAESLRAAFSVSKVSAENMVSTTMECSVPNTAPDLASMLTLSSSSFPW